MQYLFHGSKVAGIPKLEARSLLHKTDKKVVYLTDNIPYALIYIWDEKHNNCATQHVTGWIKDGTTHYEEQFPDQLKTFYHGVSGYLYCIATAPDIHSVEAREGMYYSLDDTPIDHAVFIPDVYEELCRHEAAGAFHVLRYNEQSAARQDELTRLIATAIVQSGFFTDDEPKAAFYKKYFTKAWELAADLK